LLWHEERRCIHNTREKKIRQKRPASHLASQGGKKKGGENKYFNFKEKEPKEGLRKNRNFFSEEGSKSYAFGWGVD